MQNSNETSLLNNTYYDNKCLEVGNIEEIEISMDNETNYLSPRTVAHTLPSCPVVHYDRQIFISRC